MDGSKKTQDLVRLAQTKSPAPEINIAGLPLFEAGHVWLAGVGPGDVGLLTLHAVNALQQADMIVYDALVSEDILALAKKGAQLFYAGKRGGKPSRNQADITEQLIALAQAGHRVLRLKGGDPFLFGRGGEEAQALREAEITFRIIPGISAGIGGLAYAGIPVTHRDINHAVTFVTGHLAGDNRPELMDWTAIAQGSPVIVIYMALHRLAVIAALLLKAGRDKEEPLAVVTHATTPAQKVVFSTLGEAAGEAASLVATHKLEPPAIIVVGKVVDMGRLINWV
ncbi:MAG: uroporphyrinogen-III C-methyltransferase [Alphaproteobacteria bacterium]|nr:uroporphyrinogen-III C-methyltransferase [Alphaproteobacteria bacterium]